MFLGLLFIRFDSQSFHSSVLVGQLALYMPCESNGEGSIS